MQCRSKGMGERFSMRLCRIQNIIYRKLNFFIIRNTALANYFIVIIEGLGGGGGEGGPPGPPRWIRPCILIIQVTSGTTN